MRPGRLLGLLLLAVCWVAGGGAVQADPGEGPDVERFSDPFAHELWLQFDLPVNSLWLRDPDSGVTLGAPVGYEGRTALMQAYLQAGQSVLTVGEREVRRLPEFPLGDLRAQFQVTRREGRSWAVLVFRDAQERTARYAIPQQWELKDPRASTLISVRREFERLLLKLAL